MAVSVPWLWEVKSIDPLRRPVPFGTVLLTGPDLARLPPPPHPRQCCRKERFRNPLTDSDNHFWRMTRDGVDDGRCGRVAWRGAVSVLMH